MSKILTNYYNQHLQQIYCECASACEQAHCSCILQRINCSKYCHLSRAGGKSVCRNQVTSQALLELQLRTDPPSSGLSLLVQATSSLGAEDSVHSLGTGSTIVVRQRTVTSGPATARPSIPLISLSDSDGMLCPSRYLNHVDCF